MEKVKNKVEYIDINKLVLLKNNPRKISKENMSKLLFVLKLAYNIDKIEFDIDKNNLISLNFFLKNVKNIIKIGNKKLDNGKIIYLYKGEI